MAPIIYYMLHFKERARLFYYIAMVTLFFFIENAGKIFYHQARPFWVSPDIHAYDCSTQYGCPSGHSMDSLGSTLTVWLDYEHMVRSGRIRSTSLWARWYIRLLLLVLCFAFGLSIGYSRIVLGAHAWN